MCQVWWWWLMCRKEWMLKKGIKVNKLQKSYITPKHGRMVKDKMQMLLYDCGECDMNRYFKFSVKVDYFHAKKRRIKKNRHHWKQRMKQIFKSNTEREIKREKKCGWSEEAPKKKRLSLCPLSYKLKKKQKKNHSISINSNKMTKKKQ